MNLKPEDIIIGKENFYAAIGSKPIRREFLLKSIRDGVSSGHGLGPQYFGYDKTVKEPLRVGVIGTGDEGSVLIGALNPEFFAVRAIADIRPYNIHRAFQGDCYSASQEKVRPGLIKLYDWKTEDKARENVKVYGPYQELLEHAKEDGIEAVIIALPLHLHAPAAIAAMEKGLHVLTEKLMAHDIGQCKDMARVAAEKKLLLAVGHQRHYSILYANAVELIKQGVLGDIHYIRAQWHRGNLPGNDSWQQPLPPGVKTAEEDPKANVLAKELEKWSKDLKALEAEKKPSADQLKQIEKLNRLIAQKTAQVADKILHDKVDGGKTKAETLGYESKVIKTDDSVYNRPAVEELIRWRLWDRTGAGLMAELGSHQLDASSIFIAAMHGGKMQHPLSVAASANRPLFPPDRDIEDHVYCIFEFPAPGYDPKDPLNSNKRIGVQYASVNGNGFGGYGETVFGTEGTLILEREQDVMLFKMTANATTTKTKVALATDPKDKAKKKPTLAPVEGADEERDQAIAVGQMAMLEAERGYTEELEHWAWCIRNPAPENQPRCAPKVALKDAVIALTANKAAREGMRIDFKEEWFDPDSDETPDGSKPAVKAPAKA